jgi:hypothetical protein
MARANGGQEQPRKSSHENDFLVFGTVFSEKGFALPGAEIRIRRAGEKKYRWQAFSDRRGEFAFHVVGGAEYEMSVRAKGHQEQAQKVDAKAGNRADLVIHMAPAQGGKSK